MNKRTMDQNEIQLALTKDEIEQLLHEVNNRACALLLRDQTAFNPWDSIREKLIIALQNEID